MKLPSLILLLLLLAPAAVARDRSELSTTQPFQGGGEVEIRLSSGGYVVSATDSNTVTVTYSCDSERALRDVKVTISVAGPKARVVVANTPDSHNFEATIELPRRSSLWLRLTAGELKVEGLEGDKDIEARAGDVSIEVAHPDEYGYRDASVTAGDLDAPAFSVEKGGLWRSLHQEGPGKYRLHAHLIAGNLSLTQGD